MNGKIKPTEYMSIRDILGNVDDELYRTVTYLDDLVNNGIIEGDDTLYDLRCDIIADRDRLNEVIIFLESNGIAKEEMEVE